MPFCHPNRHSVTQTDVFLTYVSEYTVNTTEDQLSRPQPCPNLPRVSVLYPPATAIGAGTGAVPVPSLSLSAPPAPLTAPAPEASSGPRIGTDEAELATSEETSTSMR